jgi:general secretion pathway protein F
MTLNLVRTGRLSGALDEMLIFVAEAGEQEARNLAKRLTSLAEPLAIAFIASIIGLIVISLVLAMSSLYSFQIN